MIYYQTIERSKIMIAYGIVDTRNNQVITWQGSFFLSKEHAALTKNRLLKTYSNNTRSILNKHLQIKEFEIKQK